MKKKNKTKIRRFSKVLCLLTFIAMVIFLVMLYRMNVLPMKYFTLIAVVMCLSQAIYMLFCINKRIKTGFLIFFNLIAIIVLIVEGFVSYKLYKTYNFLDGGMQVTETKDIYYFVVNSESQYKELKAIENKFVYYYNDLDDVEVLKTNAKNKVNAILTETNNYSELFDEVIKDKTKVILVSQSIYDSYFEDEEDPELIKKTTILDKIEIVKDLEISDSKKDITKEPFIIYLSGIDTRTNKMPSRSLSDVNMFLVINPKTRKILMVNVPRDYYVQLHGKTGLKDKLTHAGVLGGVKLSKATMEDLLGTEAEYYMRVNFNAVIKLVDAVGGITINSDVNYTFSCWTDRSCVFKPGNNKVKGKCALAFARERHAYKTGDRHRGENQQQVIQLVLNKLTSSKSLITNYDKILKALEGSMESNLSTDNITSLVQFQINDMRGWNFETANVNGSGGMQPTYSYPKSKLSVMFPDMKTVNAAKEKIKEVLNEGAN